MRAAASRGGGLRGGRGRLGVALRGGGGAVALGLSSRCRFRSRAPAAGRGPAEAARRPLPVFSQKVQVLPQTVLYIADAETFSGHEECHEQKKGKAQTNLFLPQEALGCEYSA